MSTLVVCLSSLAILLIAYFVYGRWLSRRLNAGTRFEVAAALAFLTGLTTLLGLAVIARLPEWFLLAYAAGWVVNFDLFQVLMFAMCFALMFVPTLLMGALFPLLAVTWTSSLQSAGRLDRLQNGNHVARPDA